MKTVRETIRAIATDISTETFDRLVDAFDWHPISAADVYGVRDIPQGKNWGPRIVVLIRGTPAVAYWDPTLPDPYWRTIGMTTGWSRRNQPTHFQIPHAVR